jgi:hypothetical protein
MMIACRLRHSGKKGWQIIHLCQKCGIEKANKIADGNVQPDDWTALIAISRENK